MSQSKRIVFVRQFRGFTQVEVAEKLGLTGKIKEEVWPDMKVVIENQKKIDFWK